MIALLAKLIGVAYRKRRFEIQERWKRVLPFGDTFGDRWEKARFLRFGEGSSIYDSAIVIGDVEVGSQTWVGPGCILDGSGGLVIGANCSISAGVQIYSHDTVDWAVTGGKTHPRRARTEIDDNVYIGPNSIVSAGSRVGKGSIIGALSLVKGELAPFSFAVGCPAQVIGRVDIDHDGQVSIIRTDLRHNSGEQHDKNNRT